MDTFSWLWWVVDIVEDRPCCGVLIPCVVSKESLYIEAVEEGVVWLNSPGVIVISGRCKGVKG